MAHEPYVEEALALLENIREDWINYAYECARLANQLPEEHQLASQISSSWYKLTGYQDQVAIQASSLYANPDTLNREIQALQGPIPDWQLNNATISFPVDEPVDEIQARRQLRIDIIQRSLRARETQNEADLAACINKMEESVHAYKVALEELEALVAAAHKFLDEEQEDSPEI